MARLKKFDPVGVFSQSLEECFFLQLEDRKLLNKSIIKLINNLEILASGEIKKLSNIYPNISIFPGDIRVERTSKKIIRWFTFRWIIKNEQKISKRDFRIRR